MVSQQSERSVEGVGLHVRRTAGEAPDRPEGSALPVVIVHGGMDRASSFGRVARQLADLPLVTYDRRGYGRSIEAGTTDLDGHVDDLLGLLGEEPAVLFGHSMGGVVALVAAARRPDLVRSVLAFEAPTPWAPWWPAPRRDRTAVRDPAEEAERFMRRMVGDAIWERLPSRTRQDRRSEGPALLADLDSLDRDDAPFDAAVLGCPVLSAAGGDTSWWHRRAAEELAATIPLGELAVVDGATHGAHLSHPTAVAELVRRTRRAAGGGPPADPT